tara:strand:+ start:1333 stop:1599 length:267 start_codon:yes stop_codon:yes gene_type:complete
MKKIDKNFNKLQGLMSKEVILYFRKPQIINGFKVYSTVLTYDQFNFNYTNQMCKLHARTIGSVQSFSQIQNELFFNLSDLLTIKTVKP